MKCTSCEAESFIIFPAKKIKCPKCKKSLSGKNYTSVTMIYVFTLGLAMKNIFFNKYGMNGLFIAVPFLVFFGILVINMFVKYENE